MGYDNNTYISSKGREYTNHIFDMLFKNSGGVMDVSSVDSVVGHFRGENGSHLHTTTQLIKKFIKGYEQSPFSQSYNSGIHVCPHCNRRDFMWLWEYVDFGIRNDNQDWTSSIKLESGVWAVGANNSAQGYRFLCRVRCNDATTCNECHISVTGKYSSCRSCSSSNVVQVGCGKESYTTHVVQEVQAAEWLSSSEMRQGGNATKSISVISGGVIAEDDNTRPFFYRVSNRGPTPDGLVIRDAISAFRYIPHLEIGYESNDSEHRKPYGYKCPNTDCDFERYAPLDGAEYKVPMGQPDTFNTKTMRSSGPAGNSTGPSSTVNQDGKDAQGGLVDNMGNCPNPSCGGVKLVPRIQNKEILPKNCLEKDGYGELVVKAYRRVATSTDGDGQDLAMATTQTYVNWQTNRWKNAKPDSYPFSPMIRAFTRTAKEICKNCVEGKLKKDEQTRRYDINFFWNADEGAITIACTRCGKWEPEFRQIDPQRRLNPAQPLQIVSPQPLRDGYDYAGDGLRVGSNPDSKAGTVWRIRLECAGNPEYGLLQNFLQLWSLNEIPETPTSPPTTGQDIQLCPNDVAALVSETVRAKQLAEISEELEDNGDNKIPSKIMNLNGKNEDGIKLKDYWSELQSQGEVPEYVGAGSLVEIINYDETADEQTITSSKLMPYRRMDEIVSRYGRAWSAKLPNSALVVPLAGDSTLGITSQGYTFVITEGRSKEAYIDKRTYQWVDASGPCISYHNRESPSNPLSNSITYPRWSVTPETHILNDGGIIDEDGDYYWSHNNHFSQDFIVVNDYLSIYMRNTGGEQTLMSRYHDFFEVCEPRLDPDNGSYIRIFECKTCHTMYDIGIKLQHDGIANPASAAVLAYYQGRYMANEEGEVTSPDLFPQECLDAEMAHFEGITDFGVEDELMMAMGRGGSTTEEPKTAKQMLESPKLVVNTEE